MGVEKVILKEGNGADFPKLGEKVAMEYTGWLFDPSKPDKKGSKFDSSEGRGALAVNIGQGRVIKGWDDGILGTDSTKGMSLGEKATLTISGDFAYGSRGFPGLIPPNSALVFDVELVQIGSKHA